MDNITTFECHFCKEYELDPAAWTHSIDRLGRAEPDGRKLCIFCADALDESARIEIANAAIALGRLGGKKGGVARAKALSSERRKEIAQKAAQARWRGNGK